MIRTLIIVITLFSAFASVASAQNIRNPDRDRLRLLEYHQQYRDIDPLVGDSLAFLRCLTGEEEGERCRRILSEAWEEMVATREVSESRQGPTVLDRFNGQGSITAD